GMKTAFDLIMPFLKAILESKLSNGNSGGCACTCGSGGSHDAAQPPTPIQGTSTQNGGRRAAQAATFLVSSEGDFQDRIDAIDEGQARIEMGLNKLEKMYPGS